MPKRKGHEVERGARTGTRPAVPEAADAGRRSLGRIPRASSSSGAETVRLLVTQEGDRQALHDHFARDRAREYAGYLEQVEKPTEPAGACTRSAVPTKDRLPLRILAEGDSWFKYPLGQGGHPFRDGVIFQLERLLGYPVANMAEPGEQVRQMLGLEQRQEIIDRLNDSNLHYDALLFSGGGNDLVGDQFCIWLKDTPPVPPPEKMLNQDAVSGALAVLEAEYRELVRLRNRYSEQTVIFVNCYDYPAVSGVPVCNQGPWLKPSLDWIYHQLGIATPDPKDEFLVVKTLLQQLRAMLERIASDPDIKRFVVVPTQGTLAPDSPDWQNEIHPSSAGFLKIAKKFEAALKARFP